ncbi:MAG: PorV/PorQ family protein [candidate division KSB1 bacterium]|nr:PorV/PorQ family protein [candidate division KSB1 bacterium]
MKFCKHLFMILIVAMTAVPAARAQVGLTKVAQSTMNFLLVNVSPKAAAMGETFTAVGEGAESIFFNPAGAAELSNNSAFDVKMYMTQWIADIQYMAGAVVWNGRHLGTIGLSALWVDYGTIYGTSLLSGGEQAQYPLGYKDNGTLSNVGSYALGLTYGYAVSDRFLIGGNLKYVGQNLGENMMGGSIVQNDAQKLVVDAGVKYYTGFKSFRFGMAIRNFSSNLKREEISEPLPLLFTMGLAMDILDFFPMDNPDANSLTLALDFLHPNNYTERINFGIDYTLWNALSLRAGYQTNQDVANWSTGLGIRTAVGKNDIDFAYSYSNFDVFNSVNRFSMGIRF